MPSFLRCRDGFNCPRSGLEQNVMRVWTRRVLEQLRGLFPDPLQGSSLGMNKLDDTPATGA